MLKSAFAALALTSVSASAFAANIVCEAKSTRIHATTNGAFSAVHVQSDLNSPLRGYALKIGYAPTLEQFFHDLPPVRTISINLGNGASLFVAFAGGSLSGKGKIQVPGHTVLLLDCQISG